MTVTASGNRQQHTGNGTTTAFAFSNKIVFEKSHVVVTLTDTSVSPEVDTIQVLNTDYTIADADLNEASGITVTFTTAPTANDRVTIERIVPYTQTTDYVEADDFPAETHERALDLLAQGLQQLDDTADRTFKIKSTSSITGDVTVPQPVDNRAIVWDGTDGTLKNSDSDLGNINATAAQITADKATVAADKAAAASSASDAAASATAAAASAGILTLYAAENFV